MTIGQFTLLFLSIGIGSLFLFLAFQNKKLKSSQSVPLPEQQQSSPEPEPTPEPQPDPEPEYKPLTQAEIQRHFYILGMTGQGKSTLMSRFIIGRIENGHGVCVIDRKGDLAETVLDWIPPERLGDTIYINLKNPVPIDLLSAETDDEREALAGDIKYLIAKGQSLDHAPIVQAVLDDVVHTLLNYNQNVAPDQRATFLDILNFLEDDDRQREILTKVTNPRLRRRWSKSVNERTLVSITSRLTSFVNSKSLSIIFGTPNPKLHISDVMNNRKILIVNLAPLTEPKEILGTLLIAQIRQTAFRRASLPPEQRLPFHLFVDEFQYFQTPDFAEILSVARGYGLTLYLANQYFNQVDKEIRSAIFGNVGNYIIFKIGREDAPLFKHFFPKYDGPQNFKEALEALRAAAQDASDDGRLAIGYEIMHLMILQEKGLPFPKPEILDETCLLDLKPFHPFTSLANGERGFAKPLEPLGTNPSSPAESILKRTVANYSCSTAPQCFNEVNVPPNEPDAYTGPPPDTPKHVSKKKSEGTSG